MDRIEVEGIKLFGYHGCLDEEGKIGTDYRVNVTVWGDLHRPAQTDELKDTLDYVIINRVVKQEMAVRSKLIEHVAQRILDGLMAEMPLVQKAEIKLSKLQPPINGDVESVSVVMATSR
ncbi:dihydroneopterin aldolase [Owenweeksia hongkongensis]|uniref:7,8-dihydroneopterin aldolase n=1 Tax=Owenweeksia hongkongensis (strain DSM 17368 / CIP 108786 / JCM 12287 / NRRL B-23963 / UST20020801) TaxID=926562 RepID=G8R690_OWEHD|nr:dihydroneopterin aldolase [Owenweeksia hongkongensis]AEV33310.1 dihydroneopterin aldolase [Owenweeksia hongkongensis DSM 17368]